MQNQSNVSEEAPLAWPRDFDFRAQYAEQQELLAAAPSPTIDIAAKLDIPLQGNHQND
jgi:hypothetical protein